MEFGVALSAPEEAGLHCLIFVLQQAIFDVNKARP